MAPLDLQCPHAASSEALPALPVACLARKAWGTMRPQQLHICHESSWHHFWKAAARGGIQSFVERAPSAYNDGNFRCNRASARCSVISKARRADSDALSAGLAIFQRSLPRSHRVFSTTALPGSLGGSLRGKPLGHLRAMLLSDLLQCLVMPIDARLPQLPEQSPNRLSLVLRQRSSEGLLGAEDAMVKSHLVASTGISFAADALLRRPETTIRVLARFLTRCRVQIHPGDAARRPAVRDGFFVGFRIFEDPGVDVAVGDDAQVLDSVQMPLGFEIFPGDLEAVADGHLSQQHACSGLGDADPLVQVLLAVLSSDLPNFAAIQDLPTPLGLDGESPARGSFCSPGSVRGDIGRPCLLSCCRFRWRRSRGFHWCGLLPGVVFQKVELPR